MGVRKLPWSRLFSALFLRKDGGGGGGGGGGGFTKKKKSEFVRSQLRALATRTPSLGPAVKAPGCKVCHKLESAIFE